jgi:nitroreductase
MKKIKRIIQNLLSIPAVKTSYTVFNRSFYGFISSNRLIATFFFILTPLGFNRERFAFLKGRAQYYKNLEKSNINNAHLRRNIHRIEKALIMEPRRSKFALAYIEETIDFYETILAGNTREALSVDMTELQWSRDVLTTYFSTIELDNKTTILQHRFLEACKQLPPTQAPPLVPFLRKNSPDNPVSYEEMLQLSIRRRSVRWFQDRKVPRTLIDQALLIARQSPSACNRQPFEYRIFDIPEMVQEIASIPMGTDGYSQNIKSIAVLVGKQDHFFSPRDRHIIYIDASLSAMAFMFGLEVVGLASSVINWPDFEPLEIKMQKTLGLNSYDRVIMLIAIGYAREDGGIPSSGKKSLESFRSYNKLN